MQLNHAQKNLPVSVNSTLIFSDYFQVFDWNWNLTNWSNHVRFLCRSQARIWISLSICHSLFCIQWSEVRGLSVNIDEIVDHHWLNYFFIIVNVTCMTFQISKSNLVYQDNEFIFLSNYLKTDFYLSIFFFFLHISDFHLPNTLLVIYLTS